MAQKGNIKIRIFIIEDTELEMNFIVESINDFNDKFNVNVDLSKYSSIIPKADLEKIKKEGKQPHILIIDEELRGARGGIAYVKDSFKSVFPMTKVISITKWLISNQMVEYNKDYLDCIAAFIPKATKLSKKGTESEISKEDANQFKSNLHLRLRDFIFGPMPIIKVIANGDNVIKKLESELENELNEKWDIVAKPISFGEDLFNNPANLENLTTSDVYIYEGDSNSSIDNAVSAMHKVRRQGSLIPPIMLLLTGSEPHPNKIFDWKRKGIDKICFSSEHNEAKKIINELKILIGQSKLLKEQLIRSDNSEKMNEAIEKTINLAKRISSDPIVIEGETGTGKELFARLIHYNSYRRKFKVSHLAGVAKTLIESELFGHVKGAYTGAETNKIGLFEEADGGILFIDELETLDKEIQIKLLRVIEYGDFKQLGGIQKKFADVQVVFATNETLNELRNKGELREDFYQRISGSGNTIQIPALRDRPIEDFELIINNVIDGLNLSVIALDDIASLMKNGYNEWKGNVRTLKKAVRSLVYQACADGSFTITREMVENELQSLKGQTDIESPVMGSREIAVEISGNTIIKVKSNQITLDIEETEENLDIKERTKELIVRAMKKANNNQSKAAKILGIDRATVRNKLEEYELLEKYGLNKTE